MPRIPTRLLVPTLVLIASLFLAPSLATAQSLGRAIPSATERSEASFGLFSELRSLLSAIWATGAGLDPNGASSATGHEPNSATTGDNGSGLDPNG